MATTASISRRVKIIPAPARSLGRCFLLLSAFLLLGVNLAWGQSTLWKSHFQGKTLYLMGSIHVLQANHYPLPAAMEQAFEESDVIVFEINQQEMESTASQQLFQTQGLYQSGETLQENIAPSTFEELKNYLGRLKLPITICQPMKPAYCALVITMMEFQRLGFEAKYGLDHYFADKAQRHNKKIAALESAEFQINLFFNLATKDQEKFLKQTLVEIDTFAKESDSMGKAWANGESGELHGLLSSSFQDFPGLYEKLIVNRNKAWLPQIEHFVNQHETVLVVVGAGHLVGPHSILKLLEKRGYTFSQL